MNSEAGENPYAGEETADQYTERQMREAQENRLKELTNKLGKNAALKQIEEEKNAEIARLKRRANAQMKMRRQLALNSKEQDEINRDGTVAPPHLEGAPVFRGFDRPYTPSNLRLNNTPEENLSRRFESLGSTPTGVRRIAGPNSDESRRQMAARVGNLNMRRIVNKHTPWYKFWGGKKTRKTRRKKKLSRKRRSTR